MEFPFPSYAQPLTWYDRLVNLGFFVRHVWSRPFTTHEEYPAGFDSHRVCMKTGVEQFFNNRTLQPGPLYRFRPQGGRSRR